MTVKLNLDRLRSIQITMEAIEKIEKLINLYNVDALGPAYLETRHLTENVELQIDRKFMVDALTNQMNRLILDIEDRYGFEYDPDADWTGDKCEVEHVYYSKKN